MKSRYITMNEDVDLKNVQVVRVDHKEGIEKILTVLYHGESFCGLIASEKKTENLGKMKVWECNECRKRNIGDPEALCFKILPLGYTPGDLNSCAMVKQSWNETTAYEITECKPDYNAMVKNRQFGKFYSLKEEWYGYLIGHDSSSDYPFQGCDYVKGTSPYEDVCAQTFIPCAEPEELDPITMEKI